MNNNYKYTINEFFAMGAGIERMYYLGYTPKEIADDLIELRHITDDKELIIEIL
mgnify:CR=1 FL=1